MELTKKSGLRRERVGEEGKEGNGCKDARAELVFIKDFSGRASGRPGHSPKAHGNRRDSILVNSRRVPPLAPGRDHPILLMLPSENGQITAAAGMREGEGGPRWERGSQRERFTRRAQKTDNFLARGVAGITEDLKDNVVFSAI